MNAMQLHEIIGDLIVAILLAAAIVAALLYLVLLASGGLGSSGDIYLDEIDAHLKTPDGKSWDPVKIKITSKADSIEVTKEWTRAQKYTRPGPDDEEESGPDDIEDAVIEFDTPDYSEAAPVVKTLKPKKQ